MSPLLPIKPKLENTAYCRQGGGFQTLNPIPWLNRLTSQLQALGALGVGPRVPVALAAGGTEGKVGGGGTCLHFHPKLTRQAGLPLLP